MAEDATPPPLSLSASRPSLQVLVDASVLRKALRLVHCIQKERGASCAYRAAATSNRRQNGSTPNEATARGKNLVPARRETDRAFAMLLVHSSTSYHQNGSSKGNLEKATLDKIRKVVSDEVDMDRSEAKSSAASAALPKEQSPSFHQILVCFSTLIQSILHEYVLKHSAVVSKACRKAAAAANRISRRSDQNFNSWNLPRSGSHETLQMCDSTSTAKSSSSSGMTMAIRNGLAHPELYPPPPDPLHDSTPLLSSSAPGRLPTQQLLHNSSKKTNPLVDERTFATFGRDCWPLELRDSLRCPPNSLRSGIAINFDRGRDVGDQHNEQSAGSSYLEPVRFDGSSKSGAKMAASPFRVVDSRFDFPRGSGHKDNVDTSNVDDDDEPDDETRLIQLLNLLDTFVRLKESIGVERAILSSMLAAGQVDGRLMLTDLLLELENQRRHVNKLVKLLPKTGVLHNLVRELVSMSPQMKQLQNSISQGFDWDSLKSKFDSNGELWSLLTLYIDKLHSLELILVEEIECNVSVDSNQLETISSQQVANVDHAELSVGSSSVLANTSLTAHDRIDWLNAFALDIGSTVHDLRHRVAALTPDDVKQRLLDALPADETPATDTFESDEAAASGTMARGVDELLAQLSKAPASKEWEIDLYEIRFLRRIGQGTAGTTYLADWSGLKVAVKVASISELGLDGWRNEVQALQKLHHPNIIRLLGSVCHPSPLTFCLVLEYCDAGDLSEALARVAPSNFFFRVADGMAKGGTYLHKKGVIHRDIKPGNILLEGDVPSGQFNVKLTDFGVSTDSTLSGDRTAETGTYRWMAGEVIRHESYSQSADVYSFAVVLWQLITREEPFQDQSQVEAASAVAFQYARPPFPDGTPSSIQRLVETCWSNEPDERLTFEQSITELQSVEQILTEDEKKWIEAPMGHSAYNKPNASNEIRLGPQRSNIELEVPSAQQRDDKRKKGFRTLFNRKSVHF